MTASNNIVLNVGNQGLSYAIDKELDKQLGQDVTLKYNEWTSVFDLIKQDQVENNKSQFGENDTDIKNGKQFVVQQNENYAINSTVWSKIVDIAKKNLGITTSEQTNPVTTATGTTTPAANNKDNTAAAQEEQKTSLINLLKQSGVNVDNIDIDDVMNKYNAISEYYSANNIEKDARGLNVLDRITNYAKGLEYEAVQNQMAEFDASSKIGNLDDYKDESGKIDEAKLREAYTRQKREADIRYVNQEIRDAISAGNQEQYIQASRNFGDQYIELYDNAAGDGKISFDEFNAKESKGNEDVATEDINKKVFDFLDINQDGYLDNDEVTSYLWAMSKITDGKNQRTADDITYQENMIVAQALSEVVTNDADGVFRKKFQEAYILGYENFKTKE